MPSAASSFPTAASMLSASATATGSTKLASATHACHVQSETVSWPRCNRTAQDAHCSPELQPHPKALTALQGFQGVMKMKLVQIRASPDAHTSDQVC